MPDYQTAIDANRFWNAPESDLCPLPVVAVALGVGRNFMCKIPVKPIMIAGRKCYRKSDILDWAETDEGKALWLELRAKNTSIGGYERGRSAAWDNVLGFSGPDESDSKALQIKRLWRELGDHARYLRMAKFPESEAIAERRVLAVDAFNRLAKLNRKQPSRYKGSWWLIDDAEQRAKAHKAEWEQRNKGFERGAELMKRHYDF